MSSAVHDHDGHAPASGAPQLHEVAPGIHAYVQPDGTWWINNTAFLVGSRGVVSIDACATERRTRAYLAAIASVTDKPVRMLVNTHHHGDHTYGNCLFPTAAIVAHERTRQAILDFGPPGQLPFWTPVDWGDLTVEPPMLTYSDSVTLHVDDLRCEVRHVGTAAHTTNDSIVWIPEHRILVSGDLLFNGGTPFLLMGSVTGAVSVLSGVVRPLGAEIVVPGHGPVGDASLIDEVLAYLEFVLAAAREGRRAGLSPLELARDLDLGRFAALSDRERIVGNLHRAYADLDGAEPGAPIDMVTALQEMVAYNGGRPLSCLA